MQNEKWGIDLTGRKMWYHPWKIDEHGGYLHPDEKEIADVYSVSGEAVHETLLYFEECGGDTDQLTLLLNGHIPDNRFLTNRESLLDKARWYNNEYYFYFIMFTKKVMGDYNWHFTQGENVQLSEYHIIVEHGFLRYLPYGENVKDSTNLIPYAFIQHYKSKGYDFDDLLNWADCLTIHQTPISYKNDVYKLDNYWICSEFLSYLYTFISILLNNNNMFEMVHEGFETYHLGGLSYVPESMLLRIIPYFIKKSTNYYDLEIKQNRPNTIQMVLEKTDKRENRIFEYLHSVSKQANSLTISAVREVIKKILKLDQLPEIKDITGLDTDFCAFTLQWEKKVSSFPSIPLLICNVAGMILLFINHYLKWKSFSWIILLLIPINTLFILFRRLELERRRREIAEDHILKISEDDNKRLEQAEELSNELMLEKEVLEKKVMERTAKLAEANEKLKELDSAKTNFFANISHELRTPLTLILGPLESIIGGNYGESIASGDEKFSMMLHNGSKLLKLINSLLDFTRIEAGKMPVRPQKTDIAELLLFYTSIIRTYSESKNITVAFNDNTVNRFTKAGKVFTWIDRDLFDKAIFNLLSNSLKFTPDGGSVIIQLDQAENCFTISIKDTGIGIPENKLEAIFERFTQVDDSSSRLYEGSGIGLALTQEIIGLLGGKIGVSSRLGEGSIFTITLPVRLSGDKDMDGEGESIQGLKSSFTEDFRAYRNTELAGKKSARLDLPDRKKVLIVEDSQEMQRYLASILEDEYHLIFSNNGKEGLKKAGKLIPDLILADIMMPEMDGYTMTSLIKKDERMRGIPLIMLTAKADIFMKLEGFEKGADDYIIKPFSTKELKARMKAHLEVKELRDQVVRQRDEIIERKNELESALREKNAAYSILNESEMRFRDMVGNLPAGVIEFDLNRVITFINRAGCGLFQVEADVIKNKEGILDFIHPDDRERFTAELNPIGINTGAKLIEIQFMNKNKEDFTALLKVAPVFQDNKTVGFRAMVIEIKTHLNIALLPEEQFYQKFLISQREREVFLDVIKGFKNKDISNKLFISERTVKKHITNILQKTNCGNRSELLQLVRSETQQGLD